MEKCVLGLDIGIASVGWAVVGAESEDILESGVRRFSSADASKNQDRRSFRGTRRNKRRQKHRLERLNTFLESNGFQRPDNINLSPVELRVKGLNDKLEKDQLYVSLYNIAKHRGVSYLEDLEEAKKNDSVVKNIKNSKYPYPCQIQLERLEKFGFFRTPVIDDETFINTFTLGMYEDEAKKILATQKGFYPQIDDTFIKDYLAILKSKREYYIGPGNEKSRTNYGVYKTNGETKDNLFDELRGKCSIYSGKNGMDGELRASGASYTVQHYNLLNDLCNIRVDNRKLTKKEKEEIMELIKNNSKAMEITAAIEKLYKIDASQVSGYRLNKKDLEENHNFEVYRSMRTFFQDSSLKVEDLSIDVLDSVADILTLNTETQGMLNYFNNPDSSEYAFVKDLTKEQIDLFIDFRRKHGSLFNKWSNFSYRLIKQIVPEMEETGDEQHTCIQRMQIKKYDIISSNKLDPFNIVDEIYNPVVVRSIMQSIKIVNALIKKYEFASIVIEMPRDNNDDEEKERIKKTQKANEELKETSIKYAGVDAAALDFKNHKQLREKLRLYYKQQGICLYSGRPIDIESLIRNDSSYEIDHIIPISISFDDSQANKVLVEADQNRKKSNMTPFHYLKGATGTWSYEEYKSYVLGLRKGNFIGKKQTALLLFEEDITKEEVVKGFISRNLNDTRYSSRVVLNQLQEFFKGNDKDTKVKVINGSMTSQLRKNILKYEKDRDADYRHHAEDAMICCYTDLSLKKYEKEFINLETGEIIDLDKFKELSGGERKPYFSRSSAAVMIKMTAARKNIKFSHKVDRKINRGLSNQTIYGTRKVEDNLYVVNKISDIYDDKEYEKFKKKMTNSPETFLMYKHDIKTWEKLMKIIDMYPGEKNPFKKYRDEYGKITKYSKKGNGPAVKELKYLDHKIGSHIDISHNYKGVKNKVILKSLNPFRADVYFDKNKGNFNMVPLTYNDFKFQEGKYILPISAYENRLMKEKLIGEGETFLDLEENGHEFRLSFYANDIIEFGDNDKTSIFKFLAKNHSAKNYFEVKGIDKKLDKQTYVGLTKTTTICRKYNVDMLGNMYPIEKEALVLEFKLDNKMI